MTGQDLASAASEGAASEGAASEGAASEGAASETARSLPGIVHEEALRAPGRTVLTALGARGEQVASLTAAELDHASRSLAAALLTVAAPGDRVLVPAMPALGFHVAFLACMCAHLVAVPVPPVTSPQPGGRSGAGRFSRLAAICQDARPAAVVVPGSAIGELTTAWADDQALGKVSLVPAETRSEAGQRLEPGVFDSGELAFLQYTSGSTTSPRGVMITHRAMLANQAAIALHFGGTAATIAVSWLPPYHDMGLCLGLLSPVFSRAGAVILEPETFLIRPVQWLRAISGLADVFSAAPDSGYAWCVRRVREEQKAGLDLAGWRTAVTGAEPVRGDTIRDFHAAFAGCGLSERALTPAYGLAESTLFVTGGSAHTAAVLREYDRKALSRGHALPSGQAPGPAGRVELVGCGQPGPGIRVAIIDPQTRLRCPAGAVGEIWVQSPGNGAGYWGTEEDSREVFGATPDAPGGSQQRWLRTGDLGFTDNDELFITGRHKDLLIIHGANYYPQDFEHLVRGSCPAFNDEIAAAYASGDGNRVTVVVETAGRNDPAGAVEAAAMAVRAVTAELPVTTDVVVVPRGQLPRTTSGKIRRQECARQMREARLPVIARWPRDTDADPDQAGASSLSAHDQAGGQS